MDFPIADLMNEDACYEWLVELLHPEGLACPRCGAHDDLKVHRRYRAPVLDYRCTNCRRVFNTFTETVLHKTYRRPSEIVLILRGIAQGVPTAQLARELKCNRPHLLALRHRLQESAAWARPREPLDDSVVEADEMYQNAGEKGIPHPDPDDPPRRRANKQPGHGTFENDRPPVAGMVGRQSGRMRLRVVSHADRTTLEPLVVVSTRPGALVCTDEWSAYNGLPEHGRDHATVCHAAHEWARDDDGDGVREVHCNTQEGGWTGLRNFLRNFRGVSKHYLSQYVAIYEWKYVIKAVTVEFLRALLGVRPATTGHT
jgi:transposase-like protein